MKEYFQYVGHFSVEQWYQMQTHIYFHYSGVIMRAMASQITSVLFVCSTVCSGPGQRRYQSSASLAFVWGIHRWPVSSPHKGQVTRKNVKCQFLHGPWCTWCCHHALHMIHWYDDMVIWTMGYSTDIKEHADHTLVVNAQIMTCVKMGVLFTIMSWWRYGKERYCTLLALWEGNLRAAHNWRPDIVLNVFNASLLNTQFICREYGKSLSWHLDD